MVVVVVEERITEWQVNKQFHLKGCAESIAYIILLAGITLAFGYKDKYLFIVDSPYRIL